LGVETPKSEGFPDTNGARRANGKASRVRNLLRWGKRPPGRDDARLLGGPAFDGAEYARVGRIAVEFLRGFHRLGSVGPCVTVFGSARFEPGHRYYEMGRAVGAELAGHGFAVMTGGGPGIMEAANRGAKEAGGLSVGCKASSPMVPVVKHSFAR
jgi:hypothetical protein